MGAIDVMMTTATNGSSARRLFVWGFLALTPLWIGAVPTGLAYGLAAREAGLTLSETQLMSLAVFSASAQISAVSLIDERAPVVMLALTATALNAHLLLLGLTIGRTTRASRRLRLAAAFFLTDGAYGVALSAGRVTLPSLLGAGISMFVAWNIGTAIGATAGGALPNPRGLGIDVIAPLMFLVVLVPLVRTRAAVQAAVVAGVSALCLARVAPAGTAVVGAGLLGGIAGALVAGRGCADLATTIAGGKGEAG
jgi:predicted branched-subunit amino acid permease